MFIDYWHLNEAHTFPRRGFIYHEYIHTSTNPGPDGVGVDQGLRSHRVLSRFSIIGHKNELISSIWMGYVVYTHREPHIYIQQPDPLGSSCIELDCPAHPSIIAIKNRIRAPNVDRTYYPPHVAPY